MRKVKAYIYKVFDEYGIEYAEIQTTTNPEWISESAVKGAYHKTKRLRIFYCGIYMGYIRIPFNHEIKKVGECIQI